jgi:hypothetical protein
MLMAHAGKEYTQINQQKQQSHQRKKFETIHINNSYD